MKLFLQKKAKFSSAGGSAPRPPKQPPPFRISGYAPGRNYGTINSAKNTRRPLDKFLNVKTSKDQKGLGSRKMGFELPCHKLTICAFQIEWMVLNPESRCIQVVVDQCMECDQIKVLRNKIFITSLSFHIFQTLPPTIFLQVFAIFEKSIPSLKFVIFGYIISLNLNSALRMCDKHGAKTKE